MWWIWAVETDVPWPDKPTDVIYDGVTFNLLPASAAEHASIAVYGCVANGDAISRAVHRFLSVLCWIDRRRTVTTWSVGNPGWRQPTSRMKPLASHFSQARTNFDFLPAVSSERAAIGLAFHREAVNSESLGHRFLQYFKVLELTYGNRVHRPEFVEELIAAAPQNQEIKAACDRIHQEGKGVGKRVSAYARNAIAHGYEKNVFNPDNVSESLRTLNDVLPIVESLALHAIEEKLNVRTTGTYYREHLYEVEGLLSVLSDEQKRKIESSSEPPVLVVLPFEEISIGTRERRYPALEGLVVRQGQALFGGVVVVASSEDNLVQAVVHFDARSNRLDFEPSQHIIVLDDKSTRAPLYHSDLLEYLGDLLVNAEIHVWAGDTLLGRKDPNIPMNVDVRKTLENLKRERLQLQDEVARRVAGNDGGEPPTPPESKPLA